jgi:transcriptional regulator with XRE-family HTH domain
MKQNTRLKFARMDAGLTQEELADLLGVSSITVYRWERGEHHPNPYFCGRLCRLFNVSEQELGLQERQEEEARSRDDVAFLVDPWLPAGKTPPIGQQSLLQEIGHSHHRVLGLTGLPGSGKTLLAQALGGLPEIRQQTDGILWATMSQESRPLRHLQRWIMLLGGDAVPEHLEEAQDRLRVLLRGRKMVMVLDDLWHAEDIAPYQLGSHCRTVVTTRLPVVANTVCDHIFHPRPLTESQAFHLLSNGLPITLVREHREILRALCQQVGNLPLAVEQIGKYLRREARTSSPRRFQEALTSLFQPTSYLHLPLPSDASSLAVSIKRSEGWLSVSAQQALCTLAFLLPTAPATFAERQVTDLIQTSRQFQLHDFDQLVDVGLLSITAKNRYQIHPVIAAFARLLAKKEPEIIE